MAVLSWEQIAAVALQAGFPPGAAVIAVAITQPEAGRDATVVQQGQPYATTGWGLWQITPGDSVPRYGIDKALLHPLNNARAAHWKWEQAGGFSPWTTYENGLERPYLADAEAAVAKVAHLSKKQLQQLVKTATRDGGAAAGISTRVDDWSPRVRLSAVHFGYAAKHLVGYGAGTRRLTPRLRRPRYQPPAAQNVLWTPQHQERP